MSNINDYRVVANAIGGESQASDEMLSSAVNLANKLDMLKRLGGLFEGVSFSPAAQELLDSCTVLG